MQQFIQVLISGVLIGVLYGVFSSGLTLIFGITRVINFAHGDFVTVGMFGAVVLYSTLDLNPLLAIAPIAIVTFMLGALIYNFIIRRTLTIKGISAIDAQHGQLVLTLAVSIIMVNALLMVFGPSPRSVSGFLAHTYNLGGIYVSQSRLVSFAVGVVLFVALFLLLQKTMFGKAIRATVDDRDMAAMVGINPNRVYLVSFSVGVMLTGVAGCVLAMYYPVTPTTGGQFLVIAFVTVCMGGLGDITGAFVAGIIVGIIQQLTASYIAIDLQNAGLFIAFVLILIFRPQGILRTNRVRI